MRSRPRILAVEDDADIGDLYRSVLGDAGYEVLVARDADEAMRMAAAHPDVMLLDLMLPGDGYSVLRRLRESAELRGIPVIVVSGSIPPGRHSVAGAESVVRKPFEFAGLIREIEGVRHHSQLGR